MLFSGGAPAIFPAVPAEPPRFTGGSSWRAGLAFQAIIPRASRFKVTIATGLIATVAGMFPGIAMKLLGFVAIYGLILMPMGAIIFVDWYLLKRLGLRSYYAQVSGTSFNWAAGATWFITLAVCVGLVESGLPAFQIFFVSLPGWFIAAVIWLWRDEPEPIAGVDDDESAVI